MRLIYLFVILLSIKGNANAELTRHFYDNFTKVEIADTMKERARGLMYRRILCDKCAMLFVYEEPSAMAFWMKNTYIPLDMIFIDKNYFVTDIYQNTEPLREDKIYPSSVPTQYVIELNSGIAKEYNIEIGDYIDIDYLKHIGVEYQYIGGEDKKTSDDMFERLL